jgi:hypothetical protein|uniref:Uncharacterized protein n=1 Tax=viral metagenome TaxID=1070528 RepID=A0A6C0AI68_9ZZZZ
MSTVNNYVMNNPTNRKIYVPGDEEITSAPVTYPKNPAETDQTHRQMNWLHHKPQDHAIFPIQSEAVKIEKKKP